MAVSRANAEHYTWGAGCDGWHLLKSMGLSVIEERMPAKTSERQHTHGVAQQFFYVLAGELTMDTEGKTEVLAQGMGLAVAPGTSHQASNRSGDEVRFLVVSAPPSHGDRMEM